VAKGVFSTIMSVPFIKAKVDKEVEKVLQKVEEDMIDRSPGITIYSELPDKGWSRDKIIGELTCITQIGSTAECLEQYIMAAKI